MTACSQASRIYLFDGKFVVLPKPQWDKVVVSTMVTKEQARDKARTVAQLQSIIRDYQTDSVTHVQAMETAKRLREDLIVERDELLKANADLSRKLKRRTPWATGAKLVLGGFAAHGIVKGVNAIAPNTLTWLP